jgi:PhnB protein
MATVDPIPRGFNTLTPCLIVDDGAAAIDFYKKAFGAEELERFQAPGTNTVMHATLRIGDSMMMLGTACPNMGCKSPKNLGGTPLGLYVYVRDADGAFNRAVGAGATVKTPITDMFWGDRIGTVVDPYGHEWSIATHKKDLTREQIAAGAAAMFGGNKGCGG